MMSMSDFFTVLLILYFKNNLIPYFYWPCRIGPNLAKNYETLIFNAIRKYQ